MIAVEGSPMAGLRFIDLFAGIGGFRLALESLGARCVYSSEWDPAAQEVYRANFGEVPEGDITKADAASIPDHDILCAGFPCQSFSISGKRLGFQDARGTLFFDVARIAEAKRPKVVLMENVKNFASHDGGRTLGVVKASMEGLGYRFHAKVLSPARYGIPQNRERIYMVCVRGDLAAAPFEFPEGFPLERRVADFLLPDSETAALARDRSDFVPSEPRPRPEGSEPRPIRVGSVNKGGQGERIYSPEGIAPTFCAYGGGAFSKTGGFLVNGRLRRLHPREAARLMGFPDSFRLAASDSQAYRQLGNSVVVDVLQRIGLEIAGCLAPALAAGVRPRPAIGSFRVDHRRLAPGIYLSREDSWGGDAISTYDLRFKRPNREACIPPAASHTIEHLLATALRSAPGGDRVVYFGPMGCLTGFYLVAAGMPPADVLGLVKGAVADALAMGEVPGRSERECGNARLHDPETARYALARYAEVLEGKLEIDTYPS